MRKTEREREEERRGKPWMICDRWDTENIPSLNPPNPGQSKHFTFDSSMTSLWSQTEKTQANTKTPKTTTGKHLWEDGYYIYLFIFNAKFCILLFPRILLNIFFNEFSEPRTFSKENQMLLSHWNGGLGEMLI